jgi:hypothetical protein
VIIPVISKWEPSEAKMRGKQSKSQESYRAAIQIQRSNVAYILTFTAITGQGTKIFELINFIVYVVKDNASLNSFFRNIF